MVEFIDESGKPRSDQSINEAINAFKKSIVLDPPQPTTVFYPTVIEAMTELLHFRKIFRELKEKKEGG